MVKRQTNRPVRIPQERVVSAHNAQVRAYAVFDDGKIFGFFSSITVRVVFRPLQRYAYCFFSCDVYVSASDPAIARIVTESAEYPIFETHAYLAVQCPILCVPPTEPRRI